ncbi:hypothetical protein D3C87_358700 [compost metagenome]
MRLTYRSTTNHMKEVSVTFNSGKNMTRTQGRWPIQARFEQAERANRSVLLMQALGKRKPS